MSKVLLESIDNGVVTLTMNRPEALNALTPEMLDDLSNAMARLAADPEVRVIVLTGAGHGFCAGGDVKNMDARSDSDEPLSERIRSLRQRMEVSRLLHETPKPTIAMIRGPAAGAGMSLALACDLRIASETAKITTAFARVGLSGDFGGSYFLTQVAGPAKAREMYLLADIIGAADALEVSKAMAKGGDARVLFADKATKVNRDGVSQPRVLVLTERHLELLLPLILKQ